MLLRLAITVRNPVLPRRRWNQLPTSVQVGLYTAITTRARLARTCKVSEWTKSQRLRRARELGLITTQRFRNPFSDKGPREYLMAVHLDCLRHENELVQEILNPS